LNVNFSLSLKLTFIVVLLSTAIVVSLSYINLQQQYQKEDDILTTISRASVKNFAEAHSIINSLEDKFVSYAFFNNSSIVYDNITVLIEKINEKESLETIRLNTINIYRPENKSKPETLSIYVSNDKSLIGNPSDIYNDRAFDTGDSFYILQEDKPILTIISPINISNEIVGTQEVTISMFPTTVSHEEQIKYIIIIDFICILLLIFSLLYLLRKFIVKPIILFREFTQKIGQGELNTKVELNSRDELGDLADSFNQMAKDLKESTEKISEYNRILEKVLEQKDEFIGQLGHDLKNPLTPLVGLLPIIKQKEKDPEIREHLNIIHHNVEYMRNLIFKTLKLAKLRSSNVEFDIETLNLKDEVANVVSSQMMLFRENNITMINRVKFDIFVEADQLRLSEVFKNLITNAVKYTPKTGGQIIIDAEKGDNFVTISIKDTGIGMNKEQLNRVFDEFYKADKFSSEHQSSGLGLAICKRIVEKHGGHIWVESPGEGMGSTFYFTIKLSREK